MGVTKTCDGLMCFVLCQQSRVLALLPVCLYEVYYTMPEMMLSVHRRHAVAGVSKGLYAACDESTLLSTAAVLPI